MLVHFIKGLWGQGSGPFYAESGLLLHPLVPYHLTLVNWLSLTLRVAVPVRLLRLDVRAPACTWSSSGRVEHNPA